MRTIFFMKVKGMLTDHRTLILSLAMPLVLITILGMSLQGAFSTDEKGFTTSLAIASDEEAIVTSILSVVEEEIDWLEIKLIEEATISNTLDNNGADAVLLIKNNEYELIYNPRASIAKTAIESVIHSFLQQFNYYQALYTNLPEYNQETIEKIETFAQQSENQVDVKVQSLEENYEPISSFKYYTIGMCVMFALFQAATIAFIAQEEVKQGVIKRILLSGITPTKILLANGFALAVYTAFQFAFLMVFAAFIFRVDWVAPLTTFAIFTALAFAVGGLGAFLYAITVKYETQGFATFFMSGGVTLLALIGGSFSPTSNFPEAMQIVGQYLLNGAAMHGLLLVEQGFSQADLIPTFATLLITAIIFTSAGIMILKQKEGLGR
ncbi:ABC transporter permease [Alkalihalobacillus sp. LMS39]|uniref:ABC transporter permease n=1 Tax=Alkalihalobacillus sp. LMS39 TaxID=2924032 RepID=UPI001FB3FD76|nr:ABC transporter permease [Alkalihalobacillus sp. LMS39]UOE93917.1 ABC transporter permease [Alkalihalobacillus sp. LMS39]